MPLLNSVVTLGASTYNVSEVVQTTMTNAQGEMLAIIAISVPVVGAVVAAGAAARYGLKWIRSLGRS